LYQGVKIKKVESHILLCGPELELLVVKKKENSTVTTQEKYSMVSNFSIVFKHVKLDLIQSSKENVF